MVLPGGEEGAETMRDSKELVSLLRQRRATGKLVAATGFTPAIVFGSIPQFLENGATCYPLKRLRSKIPKATDYDVVVQKGVVTSQGIGPAVVFALILAELLISSKVVNLVSRSILVDRSGMTGFRYSPPLPPASNMAMTVTKTVAKAAELTVQAQVQSKPPVQAKAPTTMLPAPLAETIAVGPKPPSQKETPPAASTACHPCSVEVENRSPKPPPQNNDSSVDEIIETHQLKKLIQPVGEKRNRRRCSECNRLTMYVCINCGDEFGLCADSTDRSCHSTHITRFVFP